MIAVIDYGMGNLRSVQKALEVAGGKAVVTSKPEDLDRAEKIVFPGVGAFGPAMKELKRRGLVGPLKDAIGSGKYFLGLCLGLQLLYETSEEAPGVKGLGVLKGKVKRFRFKKDEGRRKMGGRLKVPHMGWNTIIPHPSSIIHQTSILKGIPRNSYMYFVHSYYVAPADKGAIITRTNYGIDFVSGVLKDNICGFQFHPEKSQGAGLKILENFVKLC